MFLSSIAVVPHHSASLLVLMMTIHASFGISCIGASSSPIIVSMFVVATVIVARIGRESYRKELIKVGFFIILCRISLRHQSFFPRSIP